MSDSQVVNEGNPESSSQPAGAAPDKREWAEKVLSEILRLMDIPAKLDLKEGADGGISIAIHFEGTLPGVQPGRRSHFLDSLQVIVNKIVNRPGTERRWVSLGAGAHPEPRPPPQERGKRGAPVPAAASPQPPLPTPAPSAARPGPSAPTAGGRRAPDRPARGEEAAPATRGREPEEASLQVTEEPALAAATRSLAEKSSSLGRFYAIAAMKPEDRARVLKGAAGVAGVKVTVEGEGRSRRVVFIPEKPAPMPRQAVPDYGDDE